MRNEKYITMHELEMNHRYESFVGWVEWRASADELLKMDTD